MPNNVINEWILPCNPHKYKLVEALKDLKIIDWRQTNSMKKAQVGDFVYIYYSAPVSQILFKGAIVKVNKPVSTIDDRKYNIPEAAELTEGPVMEIAVFREYDFVEELSFKTLQINGLKSYLMGPTRNNVVISNYLHTIDMKQCEISRFDGAIPDTCLNPFPIDIIEDLQINEITETTASVSELPSDSFILNFQSPKDYTDLQYYYDNNKQTNIDILFDNSKEGITDWTVDKKAKLGDTVLFMCAKTSVDHMRHVVIDTKNNGTEDEIIFAQDELAIYQQFAGSILAVGKIVDAPYQDSDDNNNWRAEISVQILDNPISIDSFRDFIYISRTGSITRLSEEQLSKLLKIIASGNEKYQENHAKELSLKELEEYATKNSKTESVAPTKGTTVSYHRDAYIAQYTKQKANGICELCNQAAPFVDSNGNPYLESHHIIWLSRGGADSIDNTVALCPNCHKKMHIVDSQTDIDYLLNTKNKKYE